MTKQAPKLKKVQQGNIDNMPTTSGKIRYLFKEGYEKADIARILGKRYQHVRNVLITPLKRK